MPAGPQQWRTLAFDFTSLAVQSGEKREWKWRGEGGLLIGATGENFDDRNRWELTPGGIHCVEETGAIDARWKMTLRGKEIEKEKKEGEGVLRACWAPGLAQLGCPSPFFDSFLFYVLEFLPQLFI
jgi:hypothetical protein